MTATTIPVSTAADQAQATRLLVPVAVVSTLLAMTLSVIGAHDAGERFFEVAVQIVAAVVIFGLVVRRGLRQESAGGRALAMGIIGLLLVFPAFWLGVSVQLGAAAVLLGFAGRRAPSGSGKAIVALAIGALTVIAYIGIYVGDFLNTH